jgi:hypothetical protein
MELGIILRHDPLTLGSGCVENIEVKRGFCTELQNNCEGGGEEWIESQMQQTCSRHATKVRQCGKNLIIAA